MVRYDDDAVKRGSKYFRNRRGRTSIPGGGKALGGAGSIVMVILALIFGPDALSSSNGLGTEIPVQGEEDSGEFAEENEFMQFLIGDTNETWEKIFAANNQKFQPTYLESFRGATSTNGCGNATSAVGPFYCPAPQDQSIYIDLDFFAELDTRFGAPGDFAKAYVIAHEMGHHIQAITGQSGRVRAIQQRLSNTEEKNSYSIELELQADCYAGVWAHSANKRTTNQGESIIEVGDIEEGLAAAEAVGDNRIQESMGQEVNPHTWTHGSDTQRREAFETGFRSGSMESCGYFG